MNDIKIKRLNEILNDFIYFLNLLPDDEQEQSLLVMIDKSNAMLKQLREKNDHS